jgi:hypothetical protein
MIVTIHELSFEATGHFHVARHPLLDCRIQFGVSCHAMESTIGSRRSRGNEVNRSTAPTVTEGTLGQTRSRTLTNMWSST